jgi:glucose/arabinose dehydrogenase
MWILENGASIDALPGMTAPFANDNPADELNVVDVNGPDGLGRYYGFPDCTTLWNGDADPVGFPQYVGESAGRQISLGLDPARDDDWCLDGEANNTPSIYPFQAHSVPLDIKFYPGRTSSSPAHAFPNKYKNDAFIAFHGSFNRNPPTGYGVVWLVDLFASVEQHADA